MRRSPRNLISLTTLRVVALTETSEQDSFPVRVSISHSTSYVTNFNFLYVCLFDLQKERRSKRRAELQSPLAPSLAKLNLTRKRLSYLNLRKKKKRQRLKRSAPSKDGLGVPFSQYSLLPPPQLM